MRVRMCVCTECMHNACMHAFVNGCTLHACMCVCMHACMYVCMLVYLRVSPYGSGSGASCVENVCLHFCTCVYTCIHMCMCVWMCIYIYIYVRIFIYGHALRGPPPPPPSMVYGPGCPSSCGMECGFPLPPVGWLWGFSGFGSSLSF